MLGGVCIPLMLFALGVRLLEIDFSDWRTGLLGRCFARSLGW